MSIRLKRSSGAGAVPSALDSGQLALNDTDGRLFYRDSGGVIRGSALGAVKDNLNATAAPTVTSDVIDGYSVGSVWFRPTTGELWRARSVANGAARWVKFDVTDHPGYVASRWYEPMGYPGPAGGGALVVGTINLVPGVVKERMTLSQLAARVFTAGTGNFQLGIYNHDPATGLPSTLVGKTGSGSTGAVARVALALTANVTIDPGIYWFGLQADNTTVLFASVGGAATNYGALIGSASGTIASVSTQQLCGLSVTGTFATWPSSIAAATFTEVPTRTPTIEFLVASVP